MEVREIVTFIRTVPIFVKLPEEQLMQLARAAEVRECAAGDLLVEPKDEKNELFIIVEGEYRVSYQVGSGEFERELARLWPGDYFGAIAVVTGRHTTAFVRALQPGRLIVLSKETIDALFDKSPAFARALYSSLAVTVDQSIERFATVPFVRLDSYPKLEYTVETLPSRIARLCQALAVERDDDRVVVAMVDPQDARSRTFLCDVLRQYHVEFVAVAEDDFRRHAARLLGPDVDLAAPDTPFEELVTVSSTGNTVLLSERDESDLLRKAITMAIRSGASDIHVEPDEEAGRIRLRVDGKLLTIEEGIPPARLNQVISRLKVISELDIANSRRPQDGRFVVRADQRRVEFRIAVAPCEGGEKAVVRVIMPNPDFESLDNLILCGPAARFAAELFENPSGLVLITGPTGAGKTTTLYAGLHAIVAQDHGINVVTIEDPIEYNLRFATQMQVNREQDLGFASLLRTVLRQDPDVILVGEIRDQESAAMCLEAATTGHLVLSSLHTYSALETLVRLRNLGVRPYLLAAALRGVISQQLVPRLCPGCTEPVHPEEPIVQRLCQAGIVAEDTRDKLVRGVNRGDGPLDGEKGRLGVFEILSITDQLRDLVDRSAPASDLKQALSPECFFSMQQYCRFLLQVGLVSPERIESILPKRPMYREDRN